MSFRSGKPMAFPYRDVSFPRGEWQQKGVSLTPEISYSRKTYPMTSAQNIRSLPTYLIFVVGNRWK